MVKCVVWYGMVYKKNWREFGKCMHKKREWTKYSGLCEYKYKYFEFFVFSFQRFDPRIIDTELKEQMLRNIFLIMRMWQYETVRVTFYAFHRRLKGPFLEEWSARKFWKVALQVSLEFILLRWSRVLSKDWNPPKSRLNLNFASQL